MFKSDAVAATFESVNGIESVSEDEHAYFKAIDEILTLSINDKDGFIEMIAQSENPQVAAQVAKNGELLLQQQIIAIKTKSSLELLQYLEEQYADKKVLLNEAQDRLSRFKDRNLNIATNRFSNNQTRLESELQTATAVFQNVVTQLEQVKFQVTKDTPVFSILKPRGVSQRKISTKTKFNRGGLAVFRSCCKYWFCVSERARSQVLFRQIRTTNRKTIQSY